MKALPFSEPIKWHSSLSQWRTDIPVTLAAWLSYSGSMTRRMQRHCQQVRIEVLSHQIDRPTFHEARLLQLSPRQSALIREIIMHCDNQAWLYARTVAPLATVNSELPRLYDLGTTELGKLLFRHPNMQRSSFSYSCVQREQSLYQKALPANEAATRHLWARRSEFNLSGKKLLLTEVFLPAMNKRLGDKNV